MFGLPSVKGRQFVAKCRMTGCDDVVIHVTIFVTDMTRRTHPRTYVQVSRVDKSFVAGELRRPLVLKVCPDPSLARAVTRRTSHPFPLESVDVVGAILIAMRS